MLAKRESGGAFYNVKTNSFNALMVFLLPINLIVDWEIAEKG